MLKIDAHHHLWRYDSAEYGWIDERMQVLRRNFLPADLQAEMVSAGVSGTIAVQARQSLEETRWLLELASENDFIKSVVGWVPLVDAKVDAVLDEFAADTKLRAVRHVLQDEPDENYMLRDDFNRGIRELAQYNLTYDILIFERHLPQTIKFVDNHPNQKFVVDHLAKPRVKDRALSPWRERIQKLAKRQNVFCKISGLATEADHQSWTAAELETYIEVVVSAFGARRVMFGSDWPVCLLAVDYTKWVEIVADVAAPLTETEQQRIWAGTAVEAYGLKV